MMPKLLDSSIAKTFDVRRSLLGFRPGHVIVDLNSRARAFHSGPYANYKGGYHILNSSLQGYVTTHSFTFGVNFVVCR